MEKLIEVLKGTDFFIIPMVAALIVTFAKLILTYLERETKIKTESTIERILERKNSIESVIKDATKDEAKQKKLIELLRNEIDAKSQFLEEKIREEKEIQNTPEKFRFNQLLKNFEQVRQRLINEVNSLTKRANLNLTIGIISSILAIGFLFYSGWYAQIDFKDKWFNFFTFFLPKFSLLVFLGTFSFYFLNLYKSNLTVIQNYQHELNNVDFRIISIVTILLSESEKKEESLKELVTLITNSTWNKTIKKDETTIELEKMKIDNSFDDGVISKVWTAFNLYDKIKEDRNTTPNNG